VMNEYDDIVHNLIRYITGLRRGQHKEQFISKEVVAASLEHILGVRVE
jgi:hypothetical protein